MFLDHLPFILHGALVGVGSLWPSQQLHSSCIKLGQYFYVGGRAGPACSRLFSGMVNLGLLPLISCAFKQPLSTQRKFVVYVEGILNPSISLGGKLCLLVGVRTLSLLRSRHNIPPIHTPCDLHRFGSS
jgi:hypothetical protein